MAKFINILILVVVGFSLVAPISAQDENRPVVQESNTGTLPADTLKGTIKEISEEERELFGSIFTVTVFQVEVKDNGEDKVIEVLDQNRPELRSVEFKVGDKVLVDRAFIGDSPTYVITDFQRTDALFLLIALFAVLVIVVARKQGVYSLIGLAVSFFIIFEVLLKQILNGTDALVAAIISAIIIIPLNFYLAHGINTKTTYAAISTIITLIITGILAIIFVDLARLSGYTSDEAGFITDLTNGAVNLKELLLASIIIGTLGILDDITISQSSIAHQLKYAKPKISFLELFKRTLAVGRDHISSLVNTLILVYTSASLPLLLLFINADSDFLSTINREVVAEEIIIMLLSSIGLIIAVPISTYISCFFVDKRGVSEKDAHEGHIHVH